MPQCENSAIKTKLLCTWEQYMRFTISSFFASVFIWMCLLQSLIETKCMLTLKGAMHPTTTTPRHTCVLTWLNPSCTKKQENSKSHLFNLNQCCHHAVVCTHRPLFCLWFVASQLAWAPFTWLESNLAQMGCWAAHWTSKAVVNLFWCIVNKCCCCMTWVEVIRCQVCFIFAIKSNSSNNRGMLQLSR